MAKQSPPQQYLDPTEILVEVPLEQLVHLEVSLLAMIQTFHEAGVNAVYQRIIELDPEEDPESVLDDAVDLYNDLVQQQQKALEEYLSDETEPDEETGDLSEEDRLEAEPPLFDEDENPPSTTLH